jgi:hypothetical protein
VRIASRPNWKLERPVATRESATAAAGCRAGFLAAAALVAVAVVIALLAPESLAGQTTLAPEADPVVG